MEKAIKPARLPVPGDRVAIHTAAGGCYDGLTGTVMALKDGLFQDLAPAAFGLAKWWHVALDEPAMNGGKPVAREIFLPSELEILAVKNGGSGNG